MSEVEKWEYAMALPIAVKAKPENKYITVYILINGKIAYEQDFETDYNPFVTNGLRVAMDSETFMRKALIEWATNGQKWIR